MSVANESLRVNVQDHRINIRGDQYPKGMADWIILKLTVRTSSDDLD